MSDEVIITCEEELMNKLKEKCEILNITLDELIDRYIRRGLYADDYQEPRKYTMEEFLEESRKRVGEDKKKRHIPKKT